jgi:hypothetical protein
VACQDGPEALAGLIVEKEIPVRMNPIRVTTGRPGVGLWLAVFVTAVGLLASRGAIVSSDGWGMYQVAASIVDHGDVSISQGVVARGRGGAFYGVQGIGLSLVSVPAYSVARLVTGWLGLPQQIKEATVASLMPIIVGLLAGALYSLARQLGAGRGSSVVVAVGAVFGTYMLAYAKDFFSEPLAALFMVIGIRQALAGSWWLSGVGVAAAAVTRPQVFAFFPIFLMAAWSSGRTRAAVQASLPLAFGLLITLAYNFVRFAQLTEFGYAGQGFTTPLLEGALGLLFHPQKSVFLFAPVVLTTPFALAHVWSRNPLAGWLLVGNLSITFLISAMWWAWGGGWVWGPRLLLPGIIPALAAVAPWIDFGRRWRRLAVVGLIAAGFAVTAPFLVVPHGAQAAFVAAHKPVGVGPGIAEQYRLIGPVLRETRAGIGEPLERRGDIDRFASLWQVMAIKELGRSGAIIAIIGSVSLLGLAVVSGRLIWRDVRPNP